MKTAVAQMIEKVNSSSNLIYQYTDVLEILKTAEIIQYSQIKIAYLHGGMAVLQKSEVNSDEYFYNEYEKQ